MPTIIRYVNTAPHTSGDGTTNGTGNGGTNSFVSLAAAITALPQSLTGVAPDQLDEFGNATIALDIICTGATVDSGGQVALTSATWATDAGHRLRIRCDQICGPFWDTTKYHLSTNVAFNGSMQLTQPIFLTLQDLQVENTATQDNAPLAFRSDTAVAWDIHTVRGFYRCTGTTGTTTGTAVAFNAQSNATSVTSSLEMQNVTLTSTVSGSTVLSAGAHTIYIYNCTIIDRDATGQTAGIIFSRGTLDTCRLKNLLIQGAGLNYQAGNQAATQTATILTQDTTSPTAALRSKTCTFNNAASYNYHEIATDPSVAVGTNLSADAFMVVTTNGDGVVRVAPWDVGSDQFVAATLGTYDIFVSGVNLAYINLGVQHTLLGGIVSFPTTFTPGQMVVANNNLVYCDDNGTTRIICGAIQAASNYTPGCLRIVGTNLRWTGVDGNEYAAIDKVS